jgi:hydrogenase maturation factor
MKDELWKIVHDHGTSLLSKELRAAIKDDIEADSAELMRQCEERKAQRKAERKAKRKEGK